MSMDIAAANRVADNQPDNDPSDESGQCTLTQKDMQLVPVRYAMVEEPEAERAEEVDGFAPVHGGRFRRSGIRPIRSGWLYIVHSLTPDELLIFKVEPDGSGDEIILERKGSIEVLHSMVELTELHQSMLLIPTFRRQVMTRVGIGGFCHGTAHLLDPNDLPDALADDHGEYRATPEAPDQEAGADAEIDPGSYAWCDLEADPVDWQAASAGEIVGSIKGSYQNDSAILVVEDIPARVKDWAQLWKQLAEQQGDWQDKYQTENFAARAIDGFMNLDFAPHAVNAGQGNIPEWLGNADSDDQADLRDLADLYEQHREREEAVTKGSGGHRGAIGTALQPIEDDIDELSQHIAENLGTDAESVKEFVEETEQAHFNEVIGGNYALAPNGIVDVIRQQDMENFLAYANGLQEDWQSAYLAIGQDMARLAPVWHDYALVLDREVGLHIKLICKTEKYAFETLMLCGQDNFLDQYYMGDTLNPGHLLHFILTETFIDTYLAELDASQKALAKVATLITASGALGSYQAWRSNVEEQIGLRFRSIEGLADDVVADIVGEVTAKEKRLGEAVIRTLLDDAQELDLSQRFTHLLEMLPEGQRLMLVERLGLPEMGWDIPDQTVLGKLRQAIIKGEGAWSTLQRLEQELEAYKQERKEKIEHSLRRKGSNGERRWARNFNGNHIREKSYEIAQQRKLLNKAIEELAEHSFPVSENGSHGLRVGGLSLPATRAALAERNAFKQLANQPRETIRSTLDTLIRNEQDELSVSRAAGVLVNGSLAVFGGIMFTIAIRELLQAGRDDERFLEYIGNTGAQMFGMLTGGAAIWEMVVEARQRKLYEGRAFQQINNASLKAAAGSPAQLERWALVANRAMAVVAGLGGVAGAFETVRQAQKLGRAETQSERLAIQMALVGAVGTAGGGFALGGRWVVGKILGTPAARLRFLMLQLAGPVGWVVAISTILLVVGDLMASRFSLSPVQQWCQRSYWGLRSKQWDFEEHEQELGKLSGSEASVERQGLALARASHSARPGAGPAAIDLAFRLTLPGGQPPDEEKLSFGLWAGTMGGLEELTRDVLAYSHEKTEGSRTVVTYHFSPEALSQYYYVRLVVRSNLNGESPTSVYELHTRGRALQGEWRELSALTNSWYSNRLGTWPSMPLTPWTSSTRKNNV